MTDPQLALWEAACLGRESGMRAVDTWLTCRKLYEWVDWRLAGRIFPNCATSGRTEHFLTFNCLIRLAKEVNAAKRRHFLTGQSSPSSSPGRDCDQAKESLFQIFKTR